MGEAVGTGEAEGREGNELGFWNFSRDLRSRKVWGWRVSLACKYLWVFLAAEPVDLDLGEDQAGGGCLGTSTAVVSSGDSTEVTNPHWWDPQDPQPRVWRCLMCFLQGGCCSSSKPALDPPSRAYL